MNESCLANRPTKTSDVVAFVHQVLIVKRFVFFLFACCTKRGVRVDTCYHFVCFSALEVT